MKNTLKLLSVITIAAALMFALVSCGDGGGKTLVSITVTPPTKTLYNIGETLDTFGMAITAIYSDGSTAAVTISAVNISGFDSITAGTKTITVKYEDKSINFTVSVIDSNVIATPATSPPAGTYTTALYVTLYTTTAGAKIYYTTDGTTPTTASTLYSGAISVSASITLKAIAVKDGMNNSAVLTAVYTINNPSLETAATPTASPEAGTYTTAQNVTLSTTTAGATIHYTTDGTDPTTASTQYSDAISVSATTTVKAIAAKDGMNNSALLTAVYTIDNPSLETAATPTASPEAGTYAAAQNVTLSTATTGAKIYYTTDETDPTTITASTLYSGEINISATTTLKAIAIKDNMNNSDILTAVYTISGGSGTGTAPTITAVSLPNGTKGTAYSQTLTATGDTPITWSLDGGTLPAGLSLAATGAISGTPTTAGTSTFTVKAANAAGNDTKSLSITIATTGGTGTAPTITTVSLPNGTRGTAYSQTLTATGDTPITWSLDSGTLPAGLSLAGTGAISGTPTTAGKFTFTVKAANAAGNSTKPLSITIATAGSAGTAPTITTTSLPNGTRGTAYSQTLTATGDTPITWSLVNGTLPSGLTLADTGTISGTPIMAMPAGTSTFTVKAANAVGNDTKQLLITIVSGSTNVNTFTSIADFGTWLNAQPANTAATAYTVKLNVSDLGLGDFVGNSGSAMYVLRQNSTKYVNLDLSGSTFTSIGDYAFYGCTSLTSVTIPDSVTSIGYEAFRNCTGLTSVTIPNSVTSIGNGAFSGCTSPSVTIPNSVTGIGKQAFSDCTSLASITIPNSVTSIGQYAFYQCTSLTSVTIPNSVTSIEHYAFNNCTGLTSVTIPDSVTGIGQSAFAYCTSLTSVTIGNSVTSIWAYAFEYCTGLTSVTIPNSVTGIGKQAFSGCTSLTSITIPFVGKTLNGISDTHFGYIFGSSSYRDQNSYIPASLQTVIITGGNNISDYAFRNCANITSVTIGNGVTSIGEEAFYQCTSLTSVTIGNSVTSIGGSAFLNCFNLTSVTIGNSVTSIWGGAFYQCTRLTSVTIPNSVTGIGQRAFWNCTRLTSVTIPDSVTSIGDNAFSGCDNLSITWYYNPALTARNFYSYVKTVIIPDGVTTIGQEAFSRCTGLTGALIIPNSVTSKV